MRYSRSSCEPSSPVLAVTLAQIDPPSYCLTSCWLKSRCEPRESHLRLVVVNGLFKLGSVLWAHRLGHHPLSLHLGKVPACKVSVFFCAQQRLQVEAGPLALTSELALFIDTFVETIEAKGHDPGDSPEIDAGSEPTRRKVSLPLDWLVTSYGR